MPEALSDRAMPAQQRSAMLRPTTWNADARTIEVTWTTGAAVRRIDPWTGAEFDEVLDVTPDAVDMTRFEAGAVPVLDGHDRFSGVRSILGVAVSAWLADGQGYALLRLSERADVAGVVADIAGGTIRSVSFGYSVQRYAVTQADNRTDGAAVPLYRAVRWTPSEISFVPVPADPHASTRSAQPPHRTTTTPTRTTEPTMPATTTTESTTAENTTRDQQVAEVRTLAQLARLSPAFADELISRGLTTEQARSLIINEAARRDQEAGGHVNIDRRAFQPRSGSHIGADSVAQMADALAVRMGASAQVNDNPYRHARVSDMARDLLELRGVRTTDFSPTRLIERALTTTGDFPELLQAAGRRVLRQAYGSYTGGLRRVCKASTARDFRAKSALMLGEFPELLQVNEHGEFKSGALAEAKSTYSLTTYGRIFGISRQALVNDDLDAFGDMAMRIGRAASEVESKVLVNLLTSNPVMSDSVALFHASHGNLSSGAGSALQLSALTAARASMRLQKGLDGKTPIDVAPAYLIVPAALETTGEQLLAQVQPTQIGDVNPFAGKLELVVDPRLDAVSTTAWYLAASPGMVDTIEYSYLESEAGPEVLVREGFEVDGVEMKARLDFGAGVIDWRGLHKANGA